MKVYIWVVNVPSNEYGKKGTGARLTVVAEDDNEARRLMDEMMPSGLSLDAILWRKVMHETTPMVFEAENYSELLMNDGRKTQSVVHGKRLGLT